MTGSVQRHTQSEPTHDMCTCLLTSVLPLSGAGKTHTMLGTPAQHGMIPRAMAQLFAASTELEAAGWAFDMKVL